LRVIRCGDDTKSRLPCFEFGFGFVWLNKQELLT
jgi:hypothetical protein